MPRADGAFQAVNGRAPCPVCRSSGWCRQSADGSVVLCRRVPVGGRARVDRAGVPYYVHRLGPARVPFPESGTIADRLDVPPGPVADLVPLGVRADVYAAILRALSLDAVHRAALRARGLTDAEIDRREYRTLPPAGSPWPREALARRLADRFAPETLAGVPGIVRRESSRTGRAFLTIAGAPGLLIPARDLAGRIAALKIRRDDPCDAKRRYVTLSSNWEGHPGPSPGAPVHVPFPRDDGRDPDRVCLTEGELKADVSTVLDPDRVLSVSVPGVGSWRAALPVLSALSARTVRLAFDLDWQTNPHVARALTDAATGIEAAAFNLEIERW